MAKLKLDPTVAALSGKLGNMIHRRLWGKQVVSEIPDFSHRELSVAQELQVTRFAAGSRNWKGLPAEVKDRYKARARELQMPPCALFQRTAAKAPAVEAIDLFRYTGQIAETIRIEASDLVEVATVEVKIRQPGGAILEAGSAVRPTGPDLWWIYATTATAPDRAGLTVEAIATNWAGRSGSRLELLGNPSQPV